VADGAKADVVVAEFSQERRTASTVADMAMGEGRPGLLLLLVMVADPDRLVLLQQCVHFDIRQVVIVECYYSAFLIAKRLLV